MYNGVLVKNYPAPPVDKREILRYAGHRGDVDERMAALLEECLSESEKACAYRLTYCVFDVKQNDEFCRIGKLETGSALVKSRLGACEKAVVFAATIGLGMDRLIMKYAQISTAKALMMQAIGAERIEALCDVFCAELKREYAFVGDRFSAGYGDFSLTAQRDIFDMLDCARGIGLTLNDSLLMSPTKSVTALVGVGETLDI